MALSLPLASPSTIPVVQAVVAKTKVFSAVTVEFYHEVPDRKILQVKLKEIPYVIILFSGPAYDAIAASWTDATVASRLKVMFPN